MDQATLERIFEFGAVHHYRDPQRTEEENRATFGELAAPHSHDYRVTVRVSGPMDPFTGFCVDLEALEAVVEDILQPLREGDLNAAVPEFRRGELLPSCENLARWLYGRLEAAVPPPAAIRAVRVAESRELAAEYPAA